eukprot:TRINITY_DN2955_c0_g1_i1.p1 TRINITY_DN2955_c0_g1~~TRINITY_DN2955_c0_g1_i1.p1  ORF type:complete len:275 (+),score=29.86 TRINITY_DN2955_c0_g1_i1:76-900(+)
MFHISRDVASYLRGVDVAYLQGIDVTTRALVGEHGVWPMIIKREMPYFVVGESLLGDCALQPLIVKCFGLLSTAIVSAKCVVNVSNASELQKLEDKLRRASQARRAHIGSGGRAAQVLVGDFGFTFESPSSRFPFKLEQSLSLCGMRAGELLLKILIKSGKVMVGAKYHELRRRGNAAALQVGRDFMANISSVNSAANLSLRGARLSTDGKWKPLPIGSCCYASNPGLQEPRCTSSLCIVTLMDGSPEESEAALQTVNALSVDVLRGRHPRAPL